MAAGGLLVDAVGARTSWAIASGIFFVAAALAVVLTARLREVEEPVRVTSGLDRIRTLMDEIDETRQRELERGSPEIAVLAPRDAESRSTP
jgi:uncharacterized membrane protein